MVSQKEPINSTQMGYLLHMVTLSLKRKPFTPEEGSLWLHLLSDYSYNECHEAFMVYLKDRSEEFLTPGLISQIIKTKRKERWAKSGEKVEPPNGLSGDDYLKWLHDRHEAVTAPPEAPQPHTGALEDSSGDSPRGALSS